MLAYLKRHHIGIIALFIALGGTSYAATQLPSNSVGRRQIRSGAVTSTKLANGAVTPAKLSPALRARLRGTEPKAEAAWRDPAILTEISAAHQTVISQKIVTVAADAPWVSAGLSIAPGNHLWTDTRSDGRWSGNPKYFPYSDANGLPVYPGQYRVDAKADVESLIGFIGASPPTPREVSVGLSAPGGGTGGIENSGFFQAGNTMSNFESQAAGPIWLRNNDNTNYFSDVGKQVVKVIVSS
ncbi:MAG TPA: hypothetical protein VK781_03905 [Solirubrobacteraceae bacterium]|jgi:hypothetical protein|nr:hypothetical protein [Solirubrobacteraceae bacterium]